MGTTTKFMKAICDLDMLGAARSMKGEIAGSPRDHSEPLPNPWKRSRFRVHRGQAFINQFRGQSVSQRGNSKHSNGSVFVWFYTEKQSKEGENFRPKGLWPYSRCLQLTYLTPAIYGRHPGAWPGPHDTARCRPAWRTPQSTSQTAASRTVNKQNRATRAQKLYIAVTPPLTWAGGSIIGTNFGMYRGARSLNQFSNSPTFLNESCVENNELKIIFFFWWQSQQNTRKHERGGYAWKINE